MTIHRTSAAQRRIERQQLIHVLRSQLSRVQATVARQQLVIAAQERDLIDLELFRGSKACNDYVARYHSAEEQAMVTAATQPGPSNRDARGRFISKQ